MYTHEYWMSYEFSLELFFSKIFFLVVTFYYLDIATVLLCNFLCYVDKITRLRELDSITQVVFDNFLH